MPRKLVADLSLDKEALQSVIRKNGWSSQRRECLNTCWFATLLEAKQMIEAWRREYNESRLHRSLGERTPSEFASQFAGSRELTAS